MGTEWGNQSQAAQFQAIKQVLEKLVSGGGQPPQSASLVSGVGNTITPASTPPQAAIEGAGEIYQQDPQGMSMGLGPGVAGEADVVDQGETWQPQGPPGMSQGLGSGVAGEAEIPAAPSGQSGLMNVPFAFDDGARGQETPQARIAKALPSPQPQAGGDYNVNPSEMFGQEGFKLGDNPVRSTQLDSGISDQDMLQLQQSIQREQLGQSQAPQEEAPWYEKAGNAIGDFFALRDPGPPDIDPKALEWAGQRGQREAQAKQAGIQDQRDYRDRTAATKYERDTEAAGLDRTATQESQAARDAASLKRTQAQMGPSWAIQKQSKLEYKDAQTEKQVQNLDNRIRQLKVNAPGSPLVEQLIDQRNRLSGGNMTGADYISTGGGQPGLSPGTQTALMKAAANNQLGGAAGKAIMEQAAIAFLSRYPGAVENYRMLEAKMGAAAAQKALAKENSGWFSGWFRSNAKPEQAGGGGGYVITPDAEDVINQEDPNRAK